MIHCGSVHQNARVIKIELLPGPEQDDGATVEDDRLGVLEVRPRSRTNGRESVLSHRSSSPSSDYESGTGSSMHGSVPVSRSGSFRGSIGEAGDDHGATSDDVLPQEKQSYHGSSAQGMIPITTMRTFRRMSIKNSSHSDLSSSSLARGSSTENIVVQDTKDEDEDEDTNPSAEMSTGSRARVVFRFCHDVAFMREGTTVLFRHGRTKCVGKVLRML